jgi:glyoxylase-like metal-dependent hydrolase (beta-lactamase superfamily II)
MVEIIPGVHQVDGVNANTYLVLEKDGSLTLIDAGMSANGKKILDYVQKDLSKQPAAVRTIVLTHAHIDHVRGALALKKATGARVAIHERDAGYLSGKEKLPPPKGGMGILFRLIFPFFRSPVLEPDVKLKDNDPVGESLSVFYTPGHTPGSISLYDKEKKVIFVGDAITNRGGKLQGSPKAFSVDLRQANSSIEKISELDFEIMLSGHGESVKSGGKQRVKEFADSIRAK